MKREEVVNIICQKLLQYEKMLTNRKVYKVISEEILVDLITVGVAQLPSENQEQE